MSLFQNWNDGNTVDAAITYAQEHLTSWPDEYREGTLKMCWPTFPQNSPSAYCKLIRSLKASDMRLGDEEFKRLRNTSEFSNLTTLFIKNNQIKAKHIRPLLRSRSLTKLAAIYLQEPTIGDELIKAVTTSQTQIRLEQFHLTHASVSSYGAELIASSESFASLKTLRLGDNNIGALGVRAIAQSPYLMN